jgi:hypothetical protein
MSFLEIMGAIFCALIVLVLAGVVGFSIWVFVMKRKGRKP